MESKEISPATHETFDWSQRRVLVTGGASFIGSHLVELLLAKGVRRLRVVDDLSTGLRENLEPYLSEGRVELRVEDLLRDGAAREAMRDIDVVFHLAAIHGGRGYIDRHQSECAQNLALDGLVTRAAVSAGVDKFVFASSGCVYPVELQGDVHRELYLREEMVGPGFHADGLYGWAKLMAELTLEACYREQGLKSCSCRLFTAYGERGLESHALVAMISRAFLRLDPFEVWGDGTQIRNWTYVTDIVRGLVLAAERIDDATAINLGTEESITVLEAARAVLSLTGHEAKIILRTDMPTGPLNRVASNELARRLLGWTPEVSFSEGLRRTARWYFDTKRREQVEREFYNKLIER
ncbi:MAG TPA: NAD-dependent epimerase/dehydratase family protein [Pyrinomonadaceae bacterium]|nr:NAD-dependent epimerase/dehydratase family protein [Pyrinomonadaceae bacterium]